jgi:riboflavin biosynthesis pyrimidine reductase
MRQLLPLEPDGGMLADVDALAERYAADERRRPDGRPWLLANMVASADGAATFEGRSGGLAGEADRAAFAAIRSVADVIVVAAGTVRAEGYRVPRVPGEPLAGWRRRRGQAPRPRLAVVTRRCDLDPTAALFADPADPEHPPLVLTGPAADPDRRAALEPVAEVVELEPGEGGGVNLGAAVDWLGEQGAGVLLTEGGPSLLGQLLDRSLVDELCLTVAPLAVAGAAPRIAHSPTAAPVTGFELARVIESDGELLLRYVRP